MYENRHAHLVDEIIANFDKAKGQLGIRIQGEIDDINFVEIPDESQLRNEFGLNPN